MLNALVLYMCHIRTCLYCSKLKRDSSPNFESLSETDKLLQQKDDEVLFILVLDKIICWKYLIATDFNADIFIIAPILHSIQYCQRLICGLVINCFAYVDSEDAGNAE